MDQGNPKSKPPIWFQPCLKKEKKEYQLGCLLEIRLIDASNVVRFELQNSISRSIIHQCFGG